MKLLSHRGNISGVNPELENSPEYIDQALVNYDVEIDIRYVNGDSMLGHDIGQYIVEESWLIDRSDKLWLHCKDYQSLSRLTDTPLKTFYHSVEACTTIRNASCVWCHDLNMCDANSIIPLLGKNELLLLKHLPHVYAVCSDHVAAIESHI